MGTNQDSLSWHTSENAVLLNPRWPLAEAASLTEVAEVLSARFHLAGHVWLATSGSTSQKLASNKLVALSKNAFLTSAKSVNRHLQVTASDTWLQVLPRFHVGGLGIEVRAMLSQSKVIQNFERWDPARTLGLLESEKITLASMVPTQIFDLVQARLKAPADLRAVIVGGGALTESLYAAARHLGWALLPSFGMTETCSQIATASLESLQQLSMPLPQKLGHVKWRKSEDGYLEVSGPSLLSYYGQRQSNGAIQGWDPKVEHWFRSEDFVNLHTNNTEIQFLGRKNDFIKIGGEGSSIGRLREIFERVLLTLCSNAPTSAGSLVAEQVVLLDAPSSRLGTEIHLGYLATTDQKLLLEIKEKYNQEVLPFEKVREIKLVPEIPRSELGKVLWAKLKKDLYGH